MQLTEHIPAILERLSQGESLNAICKTEGFPAESTVRAWAIDQPEFGAKYARAREMGMDARADRLRGLARKALGMKAEGVQAMRLIIDTEKWYLSKIAPKKYGDKLDLAIPEGLTINVNKRTDAGNAGG